MEYRVGDVVRLKKTKNRGYTAREGWADDGQMDEFLGAEVTIGEILDGLEPYIYEKNQRFKIVENSNWYFWGRDIATLLKKADGTIVPEIVVEKPVKIKPLYLTKPEEIAKVAREIYGEDKVTEESNAVIIHFPEIQISNSDQITHTIRDLYVRIHIDLFERDEEDEEEDEMQLNIQVMGVRTTFTLPEVLNKYMHSHLSTGGFGKWMNFCLGKSDFGILISNITLDPTEEQWQLFFLSLDRYVRWESIEGGPYFKIRDIVYKDVVDTETLKRELARMVRGIPLTEFDIMNSKLILRDTPVVRDYFNKYSSIRSKSQMTEKKFEEMRKTELKLLHSSYIKIQVGDKVIDFKIIKEDIKPAEGNIDPQIVKSYIEIFNSCGLNFNIINYEREKRNQKTFGEVGIV